MEFKVYKRTETFRGPVSSLPLYQNVLIVGGKIFCSIYRYNTNLYCILEQAKCYSAVGSIFKSTVCVNEESRRCLKKLNLLYTIL